MIKAPYLWNDEAMSLHAARFEAEEGELRYWAISITGTAFCEEKRKRSLHTIIWIFLFL